MDTDDDVFMGIVPCGYINEDEHALPIGLDHAAHAPSNQGIQEITGTGNTKPSIQEHEKENGRRAFVDEKKKRIS